MILMLNLTIPIIILMKLCSKSASRTARLGRGGLRYFVCVLVWFNSCLPYSLLFGNPLLCKEIPYDTRNFFRRKSLRACRTARLGPDGASPRGGRGEVPGDALLRRRGGFRSRRWKPVMLHAYILLSLSLLLVVVAIIMNMYIYIYIYIEREIDR